MSNNRWSRLSLFFSAGLALAAFGCGDDDGGGDRPDARPTADSSPDNPDAGGGGLLRSGTIAVTEAALTNPGFDTFSGGLVRVGFSDATTGNAPEPVEGYTSNINGCLIRIWDVDTNTSSDPTDEGAVQVTGTENGPFACGFASAALGYVCQSTNAAIKAGSLDGVTTVSNVMTFPAVGTQTAPEMVGMYMLVNGHPTITDGSRLPIVDQNSEADTLTVAGLPDINLGAGDADSTFATFVGVGPVPGGAQFLLNGADEILVQMGGSDIVTAIDQTFHAQGQGFTLTDNVGADKYQPHNLPFDGSEVNFECADADTCGAEGSGGLISAIVLNGETTDAPVGALDPSDPMPAPETQYATFQCSFIVSGDPPYTATLDAGAMAAILGTNPTRIQTSVGRYRGAILAPQEDESTIVLQGHALLGWSDAE